MMNMTIFRSHYDPKHITLPNAYVLLLFFLFILLFMNIIPTFHCEVMTQCSICYDTWPIFQSLCDC